MSAEDFLTLGDVVRLSGGTLVGADGPLPRGISIDSRDVSRGDLFVAIEGNRTDGHGYVSQAFQRGAACALVKRSKLDSLEVPVGCSVVAVDDTEKALALAAREWLDRVSPRVMGVTGSVGKTTTREVLLAAMRGVGTVHSAPKSYNTMIGSSLTVLSMPKGCRFLVLEYGTSSFGEISSLVSVFPPNDMIITEVRPAHLEGLGSIEGVLKAKLEILESSRGEFLSYNADNDLLWNALADQGGGMGGLETLSVGVVRGDVRIEHREVLWSPEGPRLFMVASHGGARVEISSGLWLLHNAYSLAFAWIMARRNGGEVSFLEAARCLAPFPGRGNVVRTSDGGWMIDESYNANPASMGAAIDNLMELAQKGGLRPQAVLGGMLELGMESDHWHAVIVDKLRALKGIQKLVLVGKEWPRSGLPDFAVLVDGLDDVLELPLDLGEDTITLIKGSRGYGLDGFVKVNSKGLCDER
ncbi:MAG: UDP-N-acetylmuramoyl-tripeptide--D-alanyl-D-alanine ligase [Thermanaerothrix sp.]|nr:UDP-N-acetylmuramoyl-tripeptide--D-alanyl-D-alanine ligase [Thermanaerothrix sp.]